MNDFWAFSVVCARCVSGTAGTHSNARRFPIDINSGATFVTDKREELIKQVARELVAIKKFEAIWQKHAEEQVGTEFEDITSDLAGDARVLLAHLEEARERLQDV